MSAKDSSLGRGADICLFLTIVAAPALGGSSKLEVLPVLALLASAAGVLALIAQLQEDKPAQRSYLALGLIVFGLITLGQLIPMGPSILKLFSPRVFELRSFIAQKEASWPLSYEVSATAKEAAKLFLYALIVWTAQQRARAHRNVRMITLPVVVAGVFTASLAVIHRVLGVEQVFGVIPSDVPMSETLSTFANPNHSAGFMVLASMTSLGMAFSSRRRGQKGGYIIAAIALASIVLLSLSRGGLGALILGGILFVGFRGRYLVKVGRLRWSQILVPAGISTAVIVPLAGLLLHFEHSIRAQLGSLEADLGPGGKLDAFRDAWPMISGHPWLGIGRGAYVSVYPHYKSSVAQLTFSYPENIVIQLVSEWGVVLGTLALLGLVGAIIYRLLKADGAAASGAMIGLTAVLAQNLVDFSLELPGVAVPAAALAGAVGWSWKHRKVRPPPVAMAVLSILIILSGTSLYIAFEKGDLRRALIESNQKGVALEIVEQHALEHPANPYLAAMASYAAEVSKPPQLKTALRWANRALYLSPKYSDAHESTGRLLLRAGYRIQGFTALREAWRLSSPVRRRALIQRIIAKARTAGEIRKAVPRRVAELDILEEDEVGRLLHEAAQTDKLHLAAPILKALPLEDLPIGTLYNLSVAALAAKEYRWAERAVERLAKLKPKDLQTALLRAQLLKQRGAYQESMAALEKVSHEKDRRVLRLRLELSLQLKQYELAQTILAELRATLPSRRAQQAELFRYQARIETAQGKTNEAVHTLTNAVELAPERFDLRILRAQAYYAMRLYSQAEADLKWVLQRQPGHSFAAGLLRQIQKRKNAP